MKLRQHKRRAYTHAGPPNYGKRCKVYGPGCTVCEGYRFLLERGRFPYSFAEHWEYAKDRDMDAPSVPWSEVHALA